MVENRALAGALLSIKGYGLPSKRGAVYSAHRFDNLVYELRTAEDHLLILHDAGFDVSRIRVIQFVEIVFPQYEGDIFFKTLVALPRSVCQRIAL